MIDLFIIILTEIKFLVSFSSTSSYKGSLLGQQNVSKDPLSLASDVPSRGRSVFTTALIFYFVFCLSCPQVNA